MTLPENTPIAAMHGNEDNIPLPEGLQGLVIKSETDGKLYVINEVINYYQRKISGLTIDQVNILPHHMFEIEKLSRAKEILLALWKWRKCVRSSENEYIIKNLHPKRKERKNGIASDIVKFLQVEDANLGITFLTLECETIPLKIHESEAMKDIYILMHKADSDNQAIMENLEGKATEIEAFYRMVTEIKTQMQQGFLNVNNLLSNLPLHNNATANVEEGDIDDGNSSVIEIALGNNTAMVEHTENYDIVISPPGSDSRLPLDTEQRLEEEEEEEEEVEVVAEERLEEDEEVEAADSLHTRSVVHSESDVASVEVEALDYDITLPASPLNRRDLVLGWLSQQRHQVQLQK